MYMYSSMKIRVMYSAATKGQQKDEKEEGKGRVFFFINIFHTLLCYDVRSFIS